MVRITSVARNPVSGCCVVGVELWLAGVGWL